MIPLLDAGTIGPVGYIVSAYVAGPSLEQWLRHNRRPVSPRRGAEIVAALARAMEHAHERKILHRDLKPANIVLYAPECDGDASNSRAWENGDAASWLPRICDFGMAKLLEAEGDETRSRIACGSPSYMAPEQAEARHSEIGAATDVYGLGAILYQILAGRPPFTGKNDLDTLSQVVSQEPVALRSLRPELPRDLETICSKCLAKRRRVGTRVPWHWPKTWKRILQVGQSRLARRRCGRVAGSWQVATPPPRRSRWRYRWQSSPESADCSGMTRFFATPTVRSTGSTSALTRANRRLQEVLDAKSHTTRLLQRQLAVRQVFGATGLRRREV